ncbi:high frequency lysogenization protein HflD [Rhodospirillum rubrum]|uniref:nickel/cobalt transporter n=1 Tax=Rhodospirillum rubrum TaxID=1085 RepID=UPI0019074CB6|nr:high frequency lysogenization protein HflD [Rhodospirillum rubrum]MBK1663553.1 high frequency lysogenization protein HflD [Rhodospirillum rubrum]MBK1675646.1 high frequency lysogenization protein HflD [Rhodospirillum rubrum]
MIGRHRPILAWAAVVAIGGGLIVLGGIGLPGAGDWLTDWTRAITSRQAGFHRDLGQAVRDLAGEGGIAAELGLLIASLGYGVFHALGPGHGKAVIGAYAATTATGFRRAALLSLAAALIQATTAVVLVDGAFLVMRGGAHWANRTAERWLEPASYAAILGLGLYLGGRGLLAIVRAGRPSLGGDHPAHPGQARDEEVCAHCGHAHGPTADQLAKATEWRSAAMIALAVGIRPCSGAILVLVVANGLGLWAAGILAAYAMALGTAATVALLAVGARASRLPIAGLARRLPLSPALLGGLAGTLAGLILVVLAGLLLRASLLAPVHPLLG